MTTILSKSASLNKDIKSNKIRSSSSVDLLPKIPQKNDFEIKPCVLDEDVISLEANEEQLKKIKTSTNFSKYPKLKMIPVYRNKNSTLIDNMQNPDVKSVIVAHPAPMDAPLNKKLITPEKFGGAKFDQSGKVMQHSILGDINNFIMHATANGDIPKSILEVYENSPDFVDENLKSQLCFPKSNLNKKRKLPDRGFMALNNWNVKMKERRKQQNYLSGILSRPINMLAMNQGDFMNKNNEYKDLMDVTLPFCEQTMTKGIGAEFWNMPVVLGDDDTGLRSTLKSREQGHYEPLCHTGVPKTIQQIQGLQPDNTKSSIKTPWHRGNYLKERCDQLQHFIYSVAPHQPDIDNLEVVGNDKKYYTKVIDDIQNINIDPEILGIKNETPCAAPVMEAELPPPLEGPSLLFAYQKAKWTPQNLSGNPGIEARVTFDSHPGQKQISHLDITNDGSTCIYYNWTKVHKTDSFNLNQNQSPVFYFSPNQGVLLPGRRMLVPFIFKSNKEGVFNEQWRFNTHPRLVGGSDIIVSLKGVTVQPYHLGNKSEDIERNLQCKEARIVVDDILSTILNVIDSPPKPPSPIQLHLTEKERFFMLNPNFQYSRENVAKLNGIYKEANVQLGNFSNIVYDDWNLDISSLKKLIMKISESKNEKQTLLNSLTDVLTDMSFAVNIPIEDFAYGFAYMKVCEMSELLVLKSDETFESMIPMPSFELENNELIKSSSNTTISTSKTSKASVKSKDSKSKQAKRSTIRSNPPVVDETVAEILTVQEASEVAADTETVEAETDLINKELENFQIKKERMERFREMNYKEKFYMQTFDVVEKASLKIGDLLHEI